MKTHNRKRKTLDSNLTSDDDTTHNNASSPLAFPTMKKVQCSHAMDCNFDELAASYPDFKIQLDKVKDRQKNCPAGASSVSTNVDFEFNVSLSRALLHKNFQLHLKTIPKGYLCPPIPNRLNYVLWIKDLLKESSTFENGRYFQDSPVPLGYKGLDIGTGCSGIYPLLLSRDVFTEGKQWQFFATDIDPFTIKCAKENVNANNLGDVIQLALVAKTHDKGGPRCFKQVDSKESSKCSTPIYTALNKARKFYHTVPFCLDFCMTNPPFYSCESEASAPRAGDQRERTDMAFHESVYPGGERGFALDMMYDSLVYRNEITWYSLMISKKTNLIALQKELENIGLSRGSIRTAEFDQGKMKRWGIAWTFLTPCVRSPGEPFDNHQLLLFFI
jgi:Predicted SAM-dependent methyltransferase